MKKDTLKTSLTRKNKVLAKELKSLKNDPIFWLESPMIEATKAFRKGKEIDNPRALRKAYIDYLKGILKVLEHSQDYHLLSFPLVAHIAHLEDLDTGNIPDYLRPETVGRKPPKSRNHKFKELFVAAAMSLLMGEYSQKEASAKVARWCKTEKIDLGGKSDISLSIRIKRIRDEISNDIEQKRRYAHLCQSWQKFGSTHLKAANSMVKIIKFFTY